MGPTKRQTDPAAERTRKQQQKEVEREAAGWLMPWGKPQKDDHDFFKSCNWTKGALKERLQVGCIWEYARESRRLRGLLWLMKHKPEAGFISPLFRLNVPVFWFEGLCEYDVRRALDVWFKWLVYLADDLTENISFEKLFTERPDKLAQAFRSLSSREFFQANEVELVEEIPPISALGAPITLLGTPEHERVCYDGSELIAFRIPWGGLTDKEIGDQIARHRPANPTCKAPRGGEKKPQIMFRSYLKDLSVMRIWKLHKHNPWERLKLVAKVCGYKPCKEEAAEYKKRCKRGHAKEPMNGGAKKEMTRHRQGALIFFQGLFPGETATNY